MWMQPVASHVPAGSVPGSTDEPLGDRLKSYFDSLTAGPAPERLVRLTEALEAAFERGELQCGNFPPRR